MEPNPSGPNALEGREASRDVGFRGLKATGITKFFGPVRANVDIEFDVRPGEIHALLGENGSGKTTFLSILSGLISPDRGEVVVEGLPAASDGARTARTRGVAMVPQQFRLVPTLTVTENIVLALSPRARHSKLLKQVAGRLEDLAEQYGLQVDPTAIVGTLSMGERQRVEILRALYLDPWVILLDEPSSVLTPNEAEQLYSTLRRIVLQEGRSVVLTSHRIREVLACADRVTVLRRGHRVNTVPASGLTWEALVEMMIGGRSLPEARAAGSGPREDEESLKKPLLRLASLSVNESLARLAGVLPIYDVTLEMYAGEILGIAGVEGNGQLTLELVLAGLIPSFQGEVVIEARAQPVDSSTRGLLPRRASSGSAYIPSDRERFGVAASLSVMENLLLDELAWRSALARSPIYEGTKLSHASGLIEEFDIGSRAAGALVRHLSGGNAQKVVVAREFASGPILTLAAQPTTGLDIAMAAFVRRELREQARKGGGVLLISSDLDELLELCDRIAVMYRGRITSTWRRKDFNLEQIGAAMTGI